MNTFIQSAIITIGDELLIGQVIDTNSAFIAQELNKIGVAVKQRIAVGDNWDAIWNALDATITEHEIVIITGGLGPTADDITKPLLCQYFGGEMIVHQPTLDHVTQIFERILKRPMIERNRKQAEVPNVCTVLKNDKGTAPGMLFTKNNCRIFSLPGVPHEMKWITTQHIIPYIEQNFERPTIIHKTLLTAGIGESFLAELINEEENNLPSFIKLAYLPNYGMVRLRLTAIHANKQFAATEIEQHFLALQKKVQPYLVATDDIPMHVVVGNLLLQHKKTLATAESCTGGNIAHMLTSIAGSSAYFTGSVVCYDNRIKTELLGVQKNTLETVGAVSEETVRLMAANVRTLLKTDYAIAVSGIMGPGGATNEKPVGMVWIAVANAETIVAKRFDFRFDRERNIQLTTVNALNLLRMLIVDNH
jgi:nicotinamide-nucleotide amidase